MATSGASQTAGTTPALRKAGIDALDALSGTLGERLGSEAAEALLGELRAESRVPGSVKPEALDQHLQQLEDVLDALLLLNAPAG